jgi:hypothetical protein
MLIPFLLSLTLSAAPPGPGYLPWPAEAGPGPVRSACRPAEAAPAGRAAATLRLEVLGEELPSFVIPVRHAVASEVPSFEVPVRRPVVPPSEGAR